MLSLVFFLNDTATPEVYSDLHSLSLHYSFPFLALDSGRLDRRAFLRLATLLGMSAGAAAALAGLPRQARASLAVCRGGRLTLGARVHQLDDPHAMSWLEPANVVHPVCDPLTRTGHDTLTPPHLLSHWTVSPDLDRQSARAGKRV